MKKKKINKRVNVCLHKNHSFSDEQVVLFERHGVSIKPSKLDFTVFLELLRDSVQPIAVAMNVKEILMLAHISDWS